MKATERIRLVTSPALTNLVSRRKVDLSPWVGQTVSEETLDESLHVSAGMADRDGRLLKGARGILILGDIGKAKALAAGDPVTKLKSVESISDGDIRTSLMARLVRDAFESYKSDPAGRSLEKIKLLNKFGIDPEEHDSFPWNSADALRRARLYFRVKQSKVWMHATLKKVALPGQEELLEVLVDRIWDAVTVQDVKDTKLKFTPHGWEHSLDTVILQRRILDQSESLQRALEERFGSLDLGRAMMDLVGLLHDVGYGRLAPGESKGVHAVRSGEIFEQEFALLIRKTFGLNGRQLQEMYDAIAYHGADKRGRPDYYSASSKNEPLPFLIRLADNLDAAFTRLRAIQTHPLFIDALKEMHDLRNNADVAGNGTLMEEAVSRIKEEAYRRFDASMGPRDTVLAKGLLEKMNELSWPHFKGCEQVAKVHICEEGNKLFVTFELAGLANAGRVHEDVPEKIDGALYQLWRAYGAAKSLRFAGNRIHFRFASVVEGRDAKDRKLRIITDLRTARTGRFKPITSSFEPYTAPVWGNPD